MASADSSIGLVNRGSNWQLLAAAPVLLLALVVAAQPFVNIPFDFIAPFQAALNILPNMGSVLLVVLVAWAAMKTGRLQLVWMGSGILVLGLAILLANLVGTPISLNNGVQIQNLGAVLAGALHLAGALIAVFSIGLARPDPRQRAVALAVGYGGSIAAVTLIVIASTAGAIPEFFIPGEGGTPIRQVVITLAAGLFAAAALVVFINYIRSRSSFQYLYGLALALLALGQIAYLLTLSRGDLMAWAGRAGQWGASLYFLLALLLILRLSGSRMANVHYVLDYIFPPSSKGYRFLIESSPDAIIGLDAGGNVLVWNAAAESILGYSSREVVGRPIGDLESNPVPEGFDTQEPGEIFFRRRDGREMWLEVSVAHCTVRGSPITTVNIRDITDRKRAEEERAQLHKKLEDAHREANLYLDIMTHDIRNANTVTTMYADLMVEMLEGEPGAYAEKLRGSVEKSNEILRNVATIRRLQEEPSLLVPVNLDTVVRKEIETFPGASIRYENAPVEVRADGLLSEVFANLIGNAVKFGGPDVEITIRVSKRDGEVEVSVEDTGPGVPDDVKERLFRRLERGKARGPGEGLGLFISRMLIERYGGRIWVEDRVPGRPDEGAAFLFTLRKTTQDG